jgi:lipopolysaccharide transport system permease protein
LPSAPEAAWPAGEAPEDLWTIEPRQHGVLERTVELWRYRQLWWYFAGEAVESMYRRTRLGWLWLILRVSAPIGLQSLIFGGLLGVSSGGPPYFLFLVCGMTTWILFERSLLVVTRSLDQHRKLVTKIYFPRMILPMSAVAPGLLYLAVLLVVLVGTVIYHRYQDGVWYITLRPELLVSVAAIVVTLVFTVAVGLWTSVLQARYRDIRQGLRYFMPFWMYFTPILYPITTIPEDWRWLVALNPMTAVVEAFKWGTLGTGHLSVSLVTSSLVLVALTMVTGMWFFSREEAASVDQL